MAGLGTVINSIAIIMGGIIGHLTGKLFRQDQQDALNKACGISVIFIICCRQYCWLSELHIFPGHFNQIEPKSSSEEERIIIKPDV